MSGDDTNDYELSRRTFAKAAGAAAGGGLLGTSMGSVAAAEDGFDSTLANPRVREAKKVWDRGFRGRQDRTIGLTDSGLDARHPDIGPWNGVQAIDDDGTLRLVDQTQSNPTREHIQTDSMEAPEAPDVEGSVTVGPGAFPAGSETVITEFAPDSSAGWAKNMWGDMQLLVDAELSWSPNADASNDLEFRMDRRKDDGSWEQVARTATGSMPEKLTGVKLEFDTTYRFVAEMYINTTTTATVEGNYIKFMPDYAEVGGDIFGLDAADGAAATPKCIGWADPDSRFGTLAKPRDPDGHGSHCASIMGGSGRASAIHSIVEQDDDMATVLIPGDTLEYQVEVDPENDEGGVYVSAFGDNLELSIEGPDGRELDSSIVASDTSAFDNNVAEAPADAAGSYTVYVRPADAHAGGESVGATVSTGRVESVSVGRLADPANGEHDRAAGEVSLHSGVAPNAGLVGLQGFSAPVAMLAKFGQEFSSRFNLRTVNMSWGYVGGAPLGSLGQGTAGGVIADIKTMAEAGILTVAAAGNAATPANGNGAPAVADEALSVVATGPRDGISAYSSGGLGGFDEDGEGPYLKPDVTAPGGTLTDLATAAKADTNTDEFDKQATDPDYDRPADYTGKAGTSMASPYTNGTAGLVAEAMEFGEDTPESIRLPEPAGTELAHVMGLKSVLLSTASQTVFTAAPYHRAKAPSYQHGERDPFEGYGRVNPDAAVDAVTRDFLPASSGPSDAPAPAEADPETTYESSASEPVGLNVPEDSRAIAGFVHVRGGTLDVSLDVSHLSGGNKGMAKGSPHVDLFVYDAESPAANGEPNIVASAQGYTGSASVSVDVDRREFQNQEFNDRTFYVVAKLVNVPGVVNGFDLQAHLDLSTTYEAAAPAPERPMTATGSWKDDGSVFTGGQTNQVTVTLEGMEHVPTTAEGQRARVFYQIPNEWTVGRDTDGDGVGDEFFGDTVAVFTRQELLSDQYPKWDASNAPPEGFKLVALPDTTVSKLGSSGPLEVSLFAEAPNGLEESDEYEFGPARIVEPSESDFATFGGTQQNRVLAADTEDSVGSTTSGTDSTTSTDSTSTDSTTDTVTGTTEETTSTLSDTL